MIKERGILQDSSLGKNRVTLAFSAHRPETVPFAARAMRNHDVIVLEEPPAPGFHEMLSGNLPIADFLLESDFEYPEFIRKTYELLRQLHQEGKTILQIEPFLEILGKIHERIANGGSAKDFDSESTESLVYQTENRATAALLSYYETVLKGSFEQVLRAVQRFARADAARGILRDNMRAEAIALAIPPGLDVYVEAGYIHYYLLRALRHFLSPNHRLKPIYLMEQVVRRLYGRRQVLGPGDILTIIYTFHPGFKGEHADLLTARSMIYVKLLQKEEIAHDLDAYPHTRDEVEALKLVERLDYEDCRTLFPKVRFAKTDDARELVEDYLTQE